MRKIAVLGATGATGQHVLKLALAQEYEVVALCRNPSALPITHDNLTAVQADIFSVSSLVPRFTGCDAVISCLGTSGSYSLQRVTFYSQTMKAITDAMREAGTRRLVCMTSWVTDYRGSDPGSVFIEWMLKPFMRVTIGRTLDDMQRMEHIIQDSEDITYTIVRPPGLSNGPLTGKAVNCEKNQQYVFSTAISGIFMSRADVANFMLSTLQTPDYEQTIVAIAIAT